MHSFETVKLPLEIEGNPFYLGYDEQALFSQKEESEQLAASRLTSRLEKEEPCHHAVGSEAASG